MILSPCLLMAMVEDQVPPLPAVTLIVDPAAAFVTQVCTLARSGVLVHDGFDPVQAASTEEFMVSTVVMHNASKSDNNRMGSSVFMS